MIPFASLFFKLFFVSFIISSWHFDIQGKKKLNNTRKNRFQKVKNDLLELENNYIELKDGDLKDRELKTYKEKKNYF